MYRIALANLRYPSTPDESVTLAVQAVNQAADQGAKIICFPECYVPGYREAGKQYPPPDAAFLQRAWSAVAAAAAKGNICVILGTERLLESGLGIAALVIGAEGGTGRQPDATMQPHLSASPGCQPVLAGFP